MQKDRPEFKESNPKDALGCKKPPLSAVPMPVIFEIGTAMLEGACKYARHNYRAVGIRASVYFDALMRHMCAWWEGEDDDPDSGISHVTKALACLVVLRDAMIQRPGGRRPSTETPRGMDERHSAARYGSAGTLPRSASPVQWKK